jgi:hypothetical protein
LTLVNGRERLPGGFDVELRHGTPMKIPDNGKGLTIPESVPVNEITALGKLQVELGQWKSGEAAGE